MKNIKKRGLVLLLFSILVVFLTVKDDFQTTMTAIYNANFWWLLIAMTAIVLFWFLKSLAIHEIIQNYPKRLPLRTVFKQMVIVQFFSGVTPFSTGGQPAQIYMFKKKGFSLAKTTNIVIQDFIIYQFALVFLTTIAIALNNIFDYFPDTLLLRKLTAIGYAVNLAVAIALLFVSFSLKTTKKLTALIIKSLSKLKLIKNTDEKTQRINNRIDEFHKGAVLLRKNRQTIFKVFFYHSLALLIYFIIPLFVFRAIDNSINTPVIEVMIGTAYVMIIAAFIPTPGGTGGIEYSFMDFFKKFISSGTLSAITLTWRFITYYFGIIIGGIVFNLTGEDKK